MKTHVCQMTSVHPRKDGRIFHKECVSLARAGYKVTLLVNDGLPDETDNDVSIVDVGGYTGRFKRVVFGQPAMLFKAWKMRAAVYHFHDPELMLVGIVLQIFGKHVIYDVHEDLPNDVMAKAWIRPGLRKTVATVAAFAERMAARKLSACICTTPTITQRFSSTAGSDVVLLRNYPVMGSAHAIDSVSHDISEVRLCYAGTIAESRGLHQMITLAAKSQTRLCLMGPLRGISLEQLQQLPEWEWVDYLGVLTKDQVETEYRRQPAIGLVILLPGFGYDEALPIKLFEYMLFGLPVLCSNFPLWESIVVEAECGVAVSPTDTDEAARVIQKLKNDAPKMNRMAQLGHAEVTEKYSWEAEQEKMLALYARLTESHASPADVKTEKATTKIG